MKKHLHFSAIIFVCFSAAFSQVEPDLLLYGAKGTDYFSRLYFRNNFQKVGDDFLYSDNVDRGMNDSLLVDTVFFSFINGFRSISIRKISFSRNGTEYCSADSFSIGDTVKWKLTSDKAGDSLCLHDSLCILKHSSSGGGILLKWYLGRKYVLHSGDAFNLLADQAPVIDRVQVVPRMYKPAPEKRLSLNKLPVFFGNSVPIINRSHPDIFNLNGKKQPGILRTSSIYIQKER